MKRGEAYIVKSRYSVGSEIAKARPAVIVSNDALNATAEVVEVVYLTTKPKKELPTHACIQATGVPSTALCEQIDSVSVTLVCHRVGVCSEKEMAAIDRALMSSIGLGEDKEVTEASKLEQWLMQELVKTQAERDRYAKIIDLFIAGRGAQG